MSAGLSLERLARLDAVMAGYVGRGAVPGIVTAVCRRGEAHVATHGAMALGGPPMRRDAVFRIASLTKPIAAAAAMILVEECRLRLDDPVDDLLPELGNRRVLRSLDAALDDTVPAARPITLRDLLTLRMGMGHIMSGAAGAFPIRRALTERQLLLGPPQPAVPPGPGEWMSRLAELPLMHQPGDGWMYDIAMDVLGVLIARAAGQPLEAFLRERIFAPLGMHDTGFHVPADKLDRFATAYAPHPETGALEVYDGVADSQWARPPAFPSASGGLVSTVDDLLTFGRMMLGWGQAGKTRILARPTVALMATDQLTADQRADGRLFLGADRGWGLGMAVTITRDEVAASPGRFGWDGGLGTSWAADPTEDLTAVLLTQAAWTSPEGPKIWQDFWTGVYQAIDD